MDVVVDYGMGNLGSIENMCQRLGVAVTISSDPQAIAGARRLILPGVGAFGQGMANLRERGLIDALHRKVVEEGTPILGICLGMQLFGRHSEEGDADGLGWIEARTVRFAFEGMAPLPVPHMGWNTVDVKKPHPTFAAADERTRFYFVHSYHFRCDDPSDVLTTTRYGIEFVSAVARDNICGVQFHPEKSHRFGMRLLAGFFGVPAP